MPPVCVHFRIRILLEKNEMPERIDLDALWHCHNLLYQNSPKRIRKFLMRPNRFNIISRCKLQCNLFQKTKRKCQKHSNMQRISVQVAKRGQTKAMKSFYCAAYCRYRDENASSMICCPFSFGCI